MDRQRRSIVKPSRYQTTSSDEDIRTRPVKKTYDKNISHVLSQDINETNFQELLQHNT